MPEKILRTSLSILILLSLGSFAAAHDEDPKALSTQPPYLGPGFRGAWAARPEGRSLHGGDDPVFSIASPVDFNRSGVEMLSWVSLPEFGPGMTCGNDCWGYTSPSGREYAIMGLSDGTGFVEITQPSDPQIVAVLSGPSSLWRDIKTWQDHAYAVSEAGDGIQIFDLSQIDSGIVTFVGTQTFGGSTTATHNVAIDTTSGFLYRAGGGDHGLRIYSLADPANPTFVASWDDRYVHDCQAVTYTSGPYAGRQIVFANSGFSGGFVSTGVDIIDVTDKSNIFVVDNFFYPNPAYSHQSWLSPDRNYLYVNDELDEGPLFTTTHVIDVSDIDNPFLANTFDNGNPAVGHNVYTKGDFLYEANYRSGVRIFDIGQNPTNPPEVAFFDTYPLDDDAEFNGLWSVYPFFPSGTVIGSDRERGLFIWWVGDPLVAIDYPGGLPDIADPAGTSFLVSIVEDGPGDLVPGTELLHYDVGSGLQTVALTPQGGTSYQATLPAAPCGFDISFYVTAETTNGIVWKDPPGIAGDAYVVTASDGEGSVLAYDMESTVGWTSGAPGDDATTGMWERGNPLGTDAQPEDDHSPSGTECWFTGQGLGGGSVGDNDVDNGETTLLSPVLDVTGLSEPRIAYWRWYKNRFGTAAPDDIFLVDVSDDGGSSWVNVETLGPAGNEVAGGWYRHEFRIADYVDLTASVRVRFVASDVNNGSIVEAAIDDFEVTTRSCADCDGDGISDGMAVQTGIDPDVDLDGFPDACQALAVDTLSLSASLGGIQTLNLDAGAANAGRTYYVLGSLTGTAPGFDIGFVTVPLNFDVYTQFTIANPNTLIFPSLGTLDGNGRAAATFFMPAGFPELEGVLFYHAFVLTSPIDFVSNGQTLLLGP